MGHCAPSVADPELWSAGGCIRVADKALISSSACPSIPILHPPAVWLLPESPQVILPTLEHRAGLRIHARVVPTARKPGPHTNPGLRTRMPSFLPVVQGGPKRRSKTRAVGSHVQEGRQPRALELAAVLSREDAPATTAAATSQPCCQERQDSHRASLSLGFPKLEQPWEVGGGNGSAPCSLCFLSTLCALIFFFSCGSREQPV